MSKRDKLRKLAEQRRNEAPALNERTTPVDDLKLDPQDVELNENTSEKQVDQTEETTPEIPVAQTETTLKETTKIDSIASSEEKVPTKEPAKPALNYEEKQIEDPTESLKSAQTSEPETPNKQTATKKRSAKAKRSLIKKLDIKTTDTTSWNCNLDPEMLIRFDLMVAQEETNKVELINRIFDSERKWVEKHPEFPDKAFILENIKSKTKRDEAGLTRTTFNFTEQNLSFFKIISKKCGMKMYQYVTYLLELYTDPIE